MKKQIFKPVKTCMFVMSFFAMTCFVQSMSPANHTEAASMIGYSTADELNLRLEADTESEVLTKVNAGDSLELLESDGEWYKVKAGEETGYLKKIYVSTERTAYAKSQDLNLRASASQDAESLKQLDRGESLSVLGEEGEWTQVQVGDVTGYVKTEYITYQLTAYSKGSGVNVRIGLSPDSMAINQLYHGDSVTVLAKVTDRYKIRYEGQIGYVSAEFLTFDETVASRGNSVVEYAKQFLGNRYVYGGTSLTKGTDCSGFTMSVFRQFGVSLPRSSASQRYAGTKVNSLAEAKPGDLICYSGHVAIYMGNNKIIHASNERDGIKISYNAAYRPIVAIRRVLN